MINVESAKEMFEEVITIATKQDIIIKSAAVADYKPVSTAKEKIKKKDGNAVIELARTQDILSHLGSNKKEGQILCGFSMETENLIENSKKKLETKHADMIVANNLKENGAGFGTDTNVVTLITKDETVELPLLSKDEVANRVLSKLAAM